MINRKILFKNLIKQNLWVRIYAEVEPGLNAILNEWDRIGYTDTRWLAYMLATVYHETAFTMQPIRERGSGRDRDHNGQDDYLQKYDTRTDIGNTKDLDGDGVKYCGRGFVQLTGLANYKKFETLLNLPLIANPDLALEVAVATKILFIGMVKGSFTGMRLGNYIKDSRCDFLQCRKIINGKDCAEKIAGYATRFVVAINNSMNS